MVIKLLKPTKTKLINMFNVKKKKKKNKIYYLFSNFALRAEKNKFTLTQKYKQTTRLLLDITSTVFVWEFA